MILNGCFERLENTGVISSNALQVFQADFLPLLRNADVVSEPVKAWKNRRPLALVSPTLLYKSLTLKNLKLEAPKGVSHLSTPSNCL